MFNMKVLLLACAVALTAAELMQGYHGPVGIPAAARLKKLESTSRIVGGISVSAGTHPYFAGLIITLTTGQGSICGGTLLSSKRVLSAAQCWYDGVYQGRSITVVLGTSNLYTYGTRVQAQSVYVHPAYNVSAYQGDLAILAIPSVSFNSLISAARLPNTTESYVGIYAHAVGLGKTSDWAVITNEQTQQDAALIVMSNSECAQYYGSVVTDDIICTSGGSGWGICGGDAGGPLMLTSEDSKVPGTIIGVIEFRSSKSCQAGLPSGYIRVSSYLNWIKSLL